MEDFKFFASLEDECSAVFVEAEDFAVVGPGGGGEVLASGQALAFNDRCARFCVVTGEVAAVVEDVEPVVVDDGGGVVGRAGGGAPCDEFVGGFAFFEGDVTGGARTDGV